MRIVRLADFLDHKYDLVSEAASIQDVMRDIVESLKSAHREYIDLKTGKSKHYTYIAEFAENGDPYCKAIKQRMDYILSNINILKAKPEDLFEEINNILAVTTILDAGIKATKQADRNFIPNYQVLYRYRNDLRKLEGSLSRLTSLLINQCATRLQAFLPAHKPLAGYVVSTTAVPLSKEKLRMFCLGPDASKVGLSDPDIVNNLDVLQQVLNDPNQRKKFERMVRSFERGNIEPRDALEIRQLVGDIKARMRQQSATNKAFFDASEEKAKEHMDVPRQREEAENLQQELQKLTPAQQWARQMQDAKKEKLQYLEQNPPMMTPEQKEQAIEQRDKEHELRQEEQRQKEIEEDRERLIRHEGSRIIKELLKKRYL